MPQIRLATFEDLPPILAVSNWAAEHTAANFAVAPETLESWQDDWRDTHEMYPWFMAVDGDDVVGFAKAAPWKGRCAYHFTAEVTVLLPGRLRPLLPVDLTVEAFLDRRDLDLLERGVPHRIEHVSLRLPDQLNDNSIRISPPRVTLGFTISSKMRKLRLKQPVRVQLAGPHEDTEYLVAFDPKQLREVTIEAPLALVERIESGEGVVVAFVHLKSTEKEARRDRKPVTFFLAIFHNTDEGIPVVARVGENGDEHPMIGVTITERNE